MSTKDNSTLLFFGYEIKSDYDILGRVLASPNKKKIMYSLNFPKTLKEITLDTDLNFPTISRAIRELEIMDLININNKSYRKGKIISISNKGQDLMHDLKKRKEQLNK